MKLEHFRALNFCGYVAHYERGLKNEKIATLRRWQYLDRANKAIAERNYQLAAFLIGYSERMPDTYHDNSRSRKKKTRVKMQGAGVVLRRVQDVSQH